MKGEFLRFFLVVCLGLFVDLNVAMFLAITAGMALWLAAAFGFISGATVTYLLHEYWTFREGERRLSRKRAGSFLIVLGATFTTRVGMVALLSNLLNENMLVLAVAMGVSFLVHYTLSRNIVFRARRLPQNFSVKDIDYSQWQLPEYEELTLSAARHSHALVIPVINEGVRIRAQLERIREANLPVDVVIADGGSTDGSLDPAFLQTIPVHALLTKTGPGRLSAQLRMAYGWCLRRGYKGIVTIDGNGKDGVETVRDLVDHLKAGFDYIQGSRYRKGGRAENTPLERTIGNRLIHAPMLSLAGKRWYTDTTNGFRGYSMRYLLDPRVAPFRDVFMNYELLFYLTVRAGQLGYKTIERPVRRTYPMGQSAPTKIVGVGAKFAILRQTILAALGVYTPHSG
jgi:dolichol-phosphate mannosyltransferase